MTIDEFNSTKWRAGMYAKHTHRDEPLRVMGVDFEEALICLEEDEEEEKWSRCENCTIVEK